MQVSGILGYDVDDLKMRNGREKSEVTPLNHCTIETRLKRAQMNEGSIAD